MTATKCPLSNKIRVNKFHLDSVNKNCLYSKTDCGLGNPFWLQESNIEKRVFLGRGRAFSIESINSLVKQYKGKKPNVIFSLQRPTKKTYLDFGTP